MDKSALAEKQPSRPFRLVVDVYLPGHLHPCRMLYLEDIHFKSRKGLSPGTIYKSQSYKGTYRLLGRAYDFSDAISELDEGFIKPYSKMSYRGKPTRKMRRLMEMEANYARAMKGWLLQH